MFCRVVVFSVVMILAAVNDARCQDPAQGKGEWIQLFNGKDLEGWTPKITKHALHENFAQTFRVQDGVLQVGYDQYVNGRFDGQFGHLFYKEPFSDYRLRIEYRFVGEQAGGGPSWAVRNSGVMVHCQPPETMERNQNFPVSIEVQLLGGSGTGKRPTANLCTPGTHVVMNDQLIKRHCTESSSATYHGDQWVTVEIEVRGNQVIRHFVGGKTVLEYGQPQLDDQDPDAKRLLAGNPEKMLRGGYISLQSESHPVEFRKVELMRLDPTPTKVN